NVHGREEEIADLLGRASALLQVELLLELGDLVPEIGEGVCEIGILEADVRRPLLDLAGAKQRRERARDVVEDPAIALALLDSLPVLPNATCSPRLDVSEHVGMAAHELLVDRPRDRLEVALAALLEEQREEVDLVQQVAELVDELSRVVGERGVGDLVRLLDRVRDDRLRGLFPIPGAVTP